MYTYVNYLKCSTSQVVTEAEYWLSNNYKFEVPRPKLTVRNYTLT